MIVYTLQEKGEAVTRDSERRTRGVAATRARSNKRAGQHAHAHQLTLKLHRVQHIGYGEGEYIAITNTDANAPAGRGARQGT